MLQYCNILCNLCNFTHAVKTILLNDYGLICTVHCLQSSWTVNITQQPYIYESKFIGQKITEWKHQCEPRTCWQILYYWDFIILTFEVQIWRVFHWCCHWYMSKSQRMPEDPVLTHIWKPYGWGLPCIHCFMPLNFFLEWNHHLFNWVVLFRFHQQAFCSKYASHGLRLAFYFAFDIVKLLTKCNNVNRDCNLLRDITSETGVYHVSVSQYIQTPGPSSGKCQSFAQFLCYWCLDMCYFFESCTHLCFLSEPGCLLKHFWKYSSGVWREAHLERN